MCRSSSANISLRLLDCKHGEIIKTFPIFTGYRELFTEFTESPCNEDPYNICEGLKVSKHALQVSSVFYISLVFSGVYEEDCRINFNIVDNAQMFQVDFRFHYDGDYRKIVQNSRFADGFWYYDTQLRTPLPDFKLVNDVYVLITDEFYVVTVNGQEITPNFAIDLDRLRSYKGIIIGQLGNCAYVDMEKSFLADGGSNLISIIERNY